jgi:hypothetical protein
VWGGDEVANDPTGDDEAHGGERSDEDARGDDVGRGRHGLEIAELGYEAAARGAAALMIAGYTS